MIPSVEQEILSSRLVVIVRLRGTYDLARVLAALRDGGVRVAEVTRDTPGALDILAAPPEGLCLGTGTVLTAAHAQAAVAAGAAFLVTPIFDPETVRWCAARSVVTAVGCMTPSEACHAHRLGATFIKLFPAEIGGPAQVKAMLAPLPFLRIIPTGGVTAASAGAFLEAGCTAVAAGSAVVSEELARTARWGEITRRARALVDAVASEQGGSS